MMHQNRSYNSYQSTSGPYKVRQVPLKKAICLVTLNAMQMLVRSSELLVLVMCCDLRHFRTLFAVVYHGYKIMLPKPKKQLKLNQISSLYSAIHLLVSSQLVKYHLSLSSDDHKADISGSN